MVLRTPISSARLVLGLLLACAGLGLGELGCLNPRPDVQPSVDSHDPGNANGLEPGDRPDPAEGDPPSGEDLDDGTSGAPLPDPEAPTAGEQLPTFNDSRTTDAGPDAGADADGGL